MTTQSPSLPTVSAVPMQDGKRVRNFGHDAFYAKLARRIKDARAAAGISQSQLARAVGYVSPVSIVLIESGRTRPTLFRICAIAVVLKTTPDDLIGFSAAA